jgi:hypothetical protein
VGLLLLMLNPTVRLSAHPLEVPLDLQILSRETILIWDDNDSYQYSRIKLHSQPLMDKDEFLNLKE